MVSYWPDAANKPNATKYDIDYSTWYHKVSKFFLSRTINENRLENTIVISDQLADNINEIKNQDGENILIFGSPSASHSLLSEGLIEWFWLYVNPFFTWQRYAVR